LIFETPYILINKKNVRVKAKKKGEIYKLIKILANMYLCKEKFSAKIFKSPTYA